MKKIIMVLLIAIFIGQSCQKNDEIQQPNNATVVNKIDEIQIKFAKILAKALSENQAMRTFLKEEALKQFDNDYDVLYQMVKDCKLDNGETFSEGLMKYDGAKEILNEVESKLPLLTIFVPELPDFTAERWNTVTEIPQVAVEISDNNGIPVFDATGNKRIVPGGCVPAFPVVVIKQNERVLIDKENALKSGLISEKQEDFFENDQFSFSFMDKAFDGIKSKAEKEKNVYVNNNMDSRCITAYNLGMQWQRDYIYYGLTPTNTTGSLRNNYSEFITMFKFKKGDDYLKISDQTGDPRLPGVTSNPGSPWTEGNFEFRMIICMNSKNGTGTEINKVFNAKGTDLFDVKYKQIGSFHLYTYESITPKIYKPNVELFPWNLNSYSVGWKIMIYEEDLSETVNQSFSFSSTHASNFGLSSGNIVKIGLTYGSSSQTTSEHTYEIVTYYQSDYLGDASITFDQPVITKVTSFFGIKIYNTRDISTGIVDICVEPRKAF